MKSTQEKEYWTKRYQEERTGWDVGYPSTPLKEYIDQLEDKDIKILIPGAGNAYEAQYLYDQGFKNVYILDISEVPLQAFATRNPEFPDDQLLCANFFEHQGAYDLILEQTFFCSFPPLPETRKAYAKKMYELLTTRGKLVGLWFDIPLTGDLEKRPFGGDKMEYVSYLRPHFKIHVFEPSHNSISARQGRELFGVFVKSGNK